MAFIGFLSMVSRTVMDHSSLEAPLGVHSWTWVFVLSSGRAEMVNGHINLFVSTDISFDWTMKR